MSVHRPFTRAQRITIFNGMLAFVMVLVILQLWLLTATMNAYLGGDHSVIWPAAAASLACFLLNAGLGLDYRFEVQQREDGGGWGLVLGVEGGYMHSPGSTSWELDGVGDVTGGPDLGIEGLYVWFSLGGWGREGEER